jgi:predicted transcriptional regulator
MSTIFYSGGEAVHKKKIEPYVKVPIKIFEMGLTYSEIAVWIALKSHDFNADHRFTVYPSMRTLGAMLGMHRSKITHTLKVLHAAGIITISTRARTRGRKAHQYIMRDIEKIDDVEMPFIRERVHEAHKTIKKTRKKVLKLAAEL